MEDWKEQIIQDRIRREKEILTHYASKIEKFRSECAKVGVYLVDESIRFIDKIGIVACYPNILSQLCQNLKKEF